MHTSTTVENDIIHRLSSLSLVTIVLAVDWTMLTVNPYFSQLRCPLLPSGGE